MIKPLLIIIIVSCLLSLMVFLRAQETKSSLRFPPRNFNDYLLRNEKAIEDVRKDFREKKGKYKSAVDRFLYETDDILSRGPYSVMDKKRIPKSGDKHDYMSIGIYWWPDPSQADGLPYIRKDGHANPEANNNAFDKQSLTKMGNGISSTVLAWYITGDKKYSDYAVKQLRTWFLVPSTKMNPNLNYGQAVPGVSDGRKDGIIESLVFVHVSESIKILYKEKAITRDEYDGLVSWYKEYLKWLLESKIGKAEGAARNNHGTWYAVQVVCYAMFTGQNEIAKSMLSDYVKERIAFQIDTEGKMPEELKRTRPFHYSLYSLTAFTLLAGMGDKLGVDLWDYTTEDGRSIRKAIDFMIPFFDDPGKIAVHDITDAADNSEEPGEKLEESLTEESFFVTILRYAAVRYKDKKYLDAGNKLLDIIYTREKDKVMNLGIESDRSNILFPGSR